MVSKAWQVAQERKVSKAWLVVQERRAFRDKRVHKASKDRQELKVNLFVSLWWTNASSQVLSNPTLFSVILGANGQNGQNGSNGQNGLNGQNGATGPTGKSFDPMVQPLCTS